MPTQDEVVIRLENTQSFAAAFQRTAERNWRMPALIGRDSTLSFAALWQTSLSFAVRMQNCGVKRSSIVALNTSEIIVVLATLIATSLLGARFIVASRTVARSKIIKPTHFFRTEEAAGTKSIEFHLINEGWLPSPEADLHDLSFEGAASPDDDWLYLHTSGTTGKPKFIALSERMVLNRSAAVAVDFPYRETTMATTFGVTSRPFLARAAAALLNACAICEGRDLAFWRLSGVNLVCGAPGQLEQLFRDAGAHSMFDRVESSGANLPEWLIPRLLKHFRSVIDVYGATETNKSFQTRYKTGETGEVVKIAERRDSEIEILSPEEKPLGPEKIGSLRVRNAYLAQGYIHDETATKKAFRDGWFYPGDLAAWGKNGELIIVGREDDVINIGGFKMNAGMLDMFFKKIPGIKDAIAFNNPKIHAVNKLLVFAVFEDEQNQHETIATVCELAVKQMGFLLVPSCIRAVKTIPRTPTGDPDRLTCRKMVAKRAEVDLQEVE